MNLLAAKVYDPAAAVTKNTTAALAMTALDTANLRLAITVPAHGMVRFRLAGVLHGATTFPSILLGVMNGANVLGRVAPVQSLGNTAVATALVSVEADFIVTGLAPGAMNVDAAYGVETLVAATGLKYGGPNNATANDAFGGFIFEAWDPQPMQVSSAQLQIDANGRIDVGEILGAAVTAAGGRMEVNTTHFGGTALTQAGGRPEVNVSHYGGTAGTFAGGRPEVNASHWRGTALAAPATAGVPKVAIEAAGDFAQAAADKAWGTATRRLTDGTNIVLAKGAGVTGFNDLDAAGVRGAVGLAAANLDGQLTTITGRVDVNTSTRLAAAGYTAPDNAGIATAAAAAAAAATDTAAIKPKTDALTFTVPEKLDVNLLVVNGSPITGDGSAGNPWGPA